MPNPKITKIENIYFAHQIENMGTDYNGFNQVYQKGATLSMTPCVVRIHTSIGVTGECLGPPVPENVARYLLGRNPFARERIYNDLKRGLRHSARTDICAVDVALWDFAGKVYDAPIWQLLGGWRKTIPAYASTYHGDENGGLSTPEAFADFAEQCAEIGYPAFKIHGWGNAPIAREVANVLAVGERVGDRMDLMIDPACEYETWADALRVGRACDEAGYFWLEDPYKDGGVSIFAHKKLRELLKTPLLQTEHIFGLEQHVDFIAHGGTDFVRVGTFEDGGITGGDEGRPRGRGLWSRLRVPRRRLGAPPLHCRHPQHQLLRIGPAPSPSQKHQAARLSPRIHRRTGKRRCPRPCARAARTGFGRGDGLGLH